MPQFYDALPIDFIEPGETVAIEVDGFPVAVANIDGEYFAFQNLCPHQGTKLGGRPVEDGHFIVCPQHSSCYDIRSGACVRPSEGDGFNQDLRTFETEIVDEVVRIKV